MDALFYDDWRTLVRTATLGILGYVLLVFLLRVSGKRTLSKMNAFDFVVTIALGSSFATLMMSKDASLAQGLLAFVILIGLQFLVTFFSVRSRWLRKVVTGEPRLLMYDGQYIDEALRQCRVTHDEVRAAIRNAGLSEERQAMAVVLETDATFNVLPRGQAGSIGILAEVRGAPDDTSRAPSGAGQSSVRR